MMLGEKNARPAVPKRITNCSFFGSGGSKTSQVILHVACALDDFGACPSIAKRNVEAFSSFTVKAAFKSCAR